jgi:hypothetical protein
VKLTSRSPVAAASRNSRRVEKIDSSRPTSRTSTQPASSGWNNLHGRPEHVLDGLAQDLLGVGAGSRHRLVQQPGQLLGAGPPGRRPVRQPGQGVHDQVDDLVAEPPHLVGGKRQWGEGAVSCHGRSSSPVAGRAHPRGDGRPARVVC